MKNATEQLTRLFKSAASAAEPFVEPPSTVLEDRIIAQWRGRLLPEEVLGWPVLFVRRALACAFAVMLLAFAWGYSSLSDPTPSHAAVAEYEMQLTFAP